MSTIFFFRNIVYFLIIFSLISPTIYATRDVEEEGSPHLSLQQKKQNASFKKSLKKTQLPWRENLRRKIQKNKIAFIFVTTLTAVGIGGVLYYLLKHWNQKPKTLPLIEKGTIQEESLQTVQVPIDEKAKPEPTKPEEAMQSQKEAHAADLHLLKKEDPSLKKQPVEEIELLKKETLFQKDTPKKIRIPMKKASQPLTHALPMAAKNAELLKGETHSPSEKDRPQEIRIPMKKDSNHELLIAKKREERKQKLKEIDQEYLRIEQQQKEAVQERESKRQKKKVRAEKSPIEIEIKERSKMAENHLSTQEPEKIKNEQMLLTDNHEKFQKQLEMKKPEQQKNRTQKRKTTLTDHPHQEYIPTKELEEIRQRRKARKEQLEQQKQKEQEEIEVLKPQWKKQWEQERRLKDKEIQEQAERKEKRKQNWEKSYQNSDESYREIQKKIETAIENLKQEMTLTPKQIADLNLIANKESRKKSFIDMQCYPQPEGYFLSQTTLTKEKTLDKKNHRKKSSNKKWSKPG
jgi:hypothetical protein